MCMMQILNRKNNVQQTKFILFYYFNDYKTNINYNININTLFII